MTNGESAAPKPATPAAADSSSAAPTVVAQKDTQSVPLQALLETRQRARTAEEELAALKADMESLKQKLAAPAAAQAPVDQQARDLLTTIQNERAATRLQAELGLNSPEQVSIVQDVLKGNPGLTPAEALGIAEKRKPEAFNATAPQGFDPATHGTMRPRPAGQPVTKPIEEDLAAFHKRARELPLGRMRQEFVDQRIGNLARSALGLGHLNHK